MPTASPTHLRPTADPAPRALLPGDPGRALALAQVVLGDDRRMFNHARGLWGYSGTGLDGAPLMIQATGMGGPSAAIVLEELAALGVRTAIRVGTARALAPSLEPGDLLAVSAVLAGDGTSAAYAATGTRTLDPALTGALTQAAGRAGVVVSHDALHAPPPAAAVTEAVAADLETGALAVVAARHGIAFGAILAIATSAAGVTLGDEPLAAAGEAAGRAAARAVTPKA